MNFTKTSAAPDLTITKSGDYPFTILTPENGDGIEIKPGSLILVDFEIEASNIVAEINPEEEIPRVELRLDEHGQAQQVLENGRQHVSLWTQAREEAEAWDELILELRAHQGAHYSNGYYGVEQSDLTIVVFTP
jgi:hypothetical protein